MNVIYEINQSAVTIGNKMDLEQALADGTIPARFVDTIWGMLGLCHALPEHMDFLDLESKLEDIEEELRDKDVDLEHSQDKVDDLEEEMEALEEIIRNLERERDGLAAKLEAKH